MGKRISFIVLNHNGKHLLEKCFPSVYQLVKGSKHEVIIVDNGSTDGSTEWVQEHYPSHRTPEVRLLSLPQNVYFSRANNEGAARAKGELLFFLNNDVTLTQGCLKPLLRHFDEQDVFAVNPSVVRPHQDNVDEGVIAGHFRGGCINPDNLIRKKMPKPTQPIEIFNACGAAMLVDKEKFQKLQGFDPLYRPFYLEETDLSYRAWKQGWKSLYDPRSTVYHLHNQTIGHLVGKKRNTSYRKNQYLFVWKNIEDPTLLASHFLQLLLPKLLIPNLYEWRAIFGALQQLPEVIQARRRILPSLWSDQDVFQRTQHLLKYL